MSVIGIRNSNVKRIVFKNADGTVAGSLSITKPSKKKSKRLQYNFKEISAQIMRAKTPGSARQVMSRARSKTALLRRKLKSGDFDEKDIKSAILHAEQMEKIAKKRMKHLQEEENAKPGGVCRAELDEESELSRNDLDKQDFELDSEKIKELMKQLQYRMQEAMEEVNGMEEVSVEVKRELDPADLELLKKKHRAEELRDIMEADMKYLKAVFEKLAKEKQEASGSVSLEISGMEMPVSVTVTEPPVVTEGGSIDATV